MPFSCGFIVLEKFGMGRVPAARFPWQQERRLVKVWADLEQMIVDEAIDQWRKRLKACVKAKGQHFEHLL